MAGFGLRRRLIGRLRSRGRAWRRRRLVGCCRHYRLRTAGAVLDHRKLGLLRGSPRQRSRDVAIRHHRRRALLPARDSRWLAVDRPLLRAQPRAICRAASRRNRRTARTQRHRQVRELKTREFEPCERLDHRCRAHDRRHRNDIRERKTSRPDNADRPGDGPPAKRNQAERLSRDGYRRGDCRPSLTGRRVARARRKGTHERRSRTEVPVSKIDPISLESRTTNVRLPRCQ
jgi:hypothetical protein